MLKFRLEQKKQLIQWHNAILLESWRQRKLVVSWTLKSDTFKSVLNKIHEYIGKQHGNQWMTPTTDGATHRVLFEKVCSKKLVVKFFQDICQELNEKFPSQDPWEYLLEDPGYPDGQGEDAGYDGPNEGFGGAFTYESRTEYGATPPY